MEYKLIITEQAEEQLEACVHYLLYQLKNQQAATHFLNEMEKLYDRLEDNPYQFPKCGDVYLEGRGYREAIIPKMEYLVIYRMENDTVYVLGIFHRLENYRNKIV